jgi:tetratricopeptide (TPR) repeat protein
MRHSLHIALVATCVAFCLAAPATVSAQAETIAYVKESQRALDAAKKSYNEEKYEEAANYFIQAAQIDPGAAHHEGKPYRDLARCLFWISNYDKAVFWYDQYLKNWPKALDHKQVKAERDTANDRRDDPDKKIRVEDIHDRSLLQLVETVRTRIDDGAPAYTVEGGGTTRLYFQAIKNGYAMPELSKFASKLRAQLLSEMSARWKPSDSNPLPTLGALGEPVETSAARLATLRTLAPRQDDVDALEAWQRFVDAMKDFEGERFGEAAGGLLDAGRGLPELTYIPYAAGLAQLRSGDGPAALATLRAARPGAPKAVAPYYRLLEAEALRASGKHKEAAEAFLEVAR